MSDAECYVIDRAVFKQLLDKNPSLVGEIGKLLLEREMKLKIETRGPDAPRRRAQHVEQQDLLGRIKSFFGID